MKAILIGATGLVGGFILKELLKDDFFEEVRIFVRKPTGISHPKLREFVNDLADIDSLSRDIQGDVLFNAIGTTIKQAGSEAEQQRIDRDIPVSFARIASLNGAGFMLNVSSMGASPKGGFYLRTKAEMEQGTERFFPERVYHFRPGLLLGKRKEFRLGEKIAQGVMPFIDPLLAGSLKKYRCMPADKLAVAMVALAKNREGRPDILYYTEIMDSIPENSF